VIICHGSSTPKAIKNAILVAERTVKQRVNEHLRELLAQFKNNNSLHVEE